MPSVSQRQHAFFEWIANDPAAAGKTGVARSVASDFVTADKGRDLKRLPDRVAKKATGGSVYPPRFKW